MATPVFLPGESHGQSYSPCGHKELDMTKLLSTHRHTYQILFLTQSCPLFWLNTFNIFSYCTTIVLDSRSNYLQVSFFPFITSITRLSRVLAAPCGVSHWGAQAPEPSGSVAVARGLSCSVACGILIPQPGMETMSTALQSEFFNHWTTRVVRVFTVLCFSVCWFKWGKSGLFHFQSEGTLFWPNYVAWTVGTLVLFSIW